MSKLIIGTANFGGNYGVLNNNFNSKYKLKKINDYLQKNKILIFDCALDYKYLKENLSLVRKKKFIINTKIKFPKKKQLKFVKNFEKNFFKHLKLFKKKNIDTLFFHNSIDLDNPLFEELLKKIFIFKKKKIIKKIGVSIYCKKEVNLILKKFKPDVLQLPLNVLNGKEFDKNYVDSLRKKNIKIHIRSIFFQGLLCQNKYIIEKYVINKSIKKKLIEFINFSLKIKRPQLDVALNYIYKFNFDNMIIGFDDIKQLYNLVQYNKDNSFITKIKFPEKLLGKLCPRNIMKL